MTKSRGIGRGGARPNSGRIKLIKFKPTKENLALLSKWQTLGYNSQDDLINFCLAVVGKELI